MVMPRKLSNSKTLINTKNETESKQNGNVYCDKKGNVMIRVLAKPGAKINRITEITEEGIGVQINAPPVDGEANTELIKYISSILNIRKSDICLERGSKSRQKLLLLTSGIISADQVMEKLRSAFHK